MRKLTQQKLVLLFLVLLSILGRTVLATGVSMLVGAFYYPWYNDDTHGNQDQWRHWNLNNHIPPDNIASAFYPKQDVASGNAYSTKTLNVLNSQMGYFNNAHTGVVIISWWGINSYPDYRLNDVITKAVANGLTISFALPDYKVNGLERTPGDVVNTAIPHLIAAANSVSANALLKISRKTPADQTTALRPIFYIYKANHFSTSDWKTALDSIRGTSNDAIVLGTGSFSYITNGHFDGKYVYAPASSTAQTHFCYQAYHVEYQMCSDANHTICPLYVPSGAPGFDNRPIGGNTFVDRQAGARYDSRWDKINSSWASRATVATFNEWGEGSGIEQVKCAGGYDGQGHCIASRGGFSYYNYNNAWGLHDASAEPAYQNHTKTWVDTFVNSRSNSHCTQ